MVRILTVVESSGVADSIAREISELKLGVETASTAAEALACLAAATYELVILDLATPGAGASTLIRIRELGHTMPVLVLVSAEATAALLPALTPLLKLGVEGFIVKPPKPGELGRRVRRALRMSPSTQVPRTGVLRALALKAPPERPPVTEALVLDGHEHVALALRSVLPPELSLSASRSVSSALARCREVSYRVVFVDADTVGAAAFADEIRVIAPGAVLVAMGLRTTSPAERDAWSRRADAFLLKPFDAASVADAILPRLAEEDAIVISGHAARVEPPSGAPATAARFQRLEERLIRFLVGAASSCFREAVIDLTLLPRDAERQPKLRDSLTGHARGLGLELRFVEREPVSASHP